MAKVELCLGDGVRSGLRLITEGLCVCWIVLWHESNEEEAEEVRYRVSCDAVNA